MELRNLHTFLAVAEALSFTRAANSLGYAQSTVTAQIQALEHELGVPVFERLGKRVLLTAAGERLQAYARRLTQLEEELMVAVPGVTEPAGTLRVGSPQSVCAYRLPALLKRFRERYPQVKLVIQSGSNAELCSAVAEGSLDVTFFMGPSSQADALVVEVLRVEPIRVVALPNHRLARKREVQPQDLADEMILHTEHDSAYRIMFDQDLLAAGVTPQVAVEFSAIEAVKQCALAGMGLAVLPEMAVAQELEARRLVALAWHDRDFEVLTQMALHKQKWLSPALVAFTETVRSYVGSAPKARSRPRPSRA
ncbi:MAG: transcriptional regulator [Cyanobacteria bacterium RYN_339]|nr:transcriptional regulator [Cyanobacteria bacterium RYN_339]